MSWDDEILSCPICKTDKCVPPRGPQNSPVLIIGAYPGEEEVKLMMPMVGASGGVLREELARCGIDIKQLRICNLWFHMPPKETWSIDYPCFQDGATRAILEAQNRKAILLIGAETVKYLCGVSVEAYNGLLVTSNYLSAPIIQSCVQPTTVWHQSLGEFRLSIQKFSKRIEDLL